MLAFVMSVCVLAQTGLVYAEETVSLSDHTQTPPVLGLERFVAFQEQYHIGEVMGIQVPTVVNVPIQKQYERPQFAVLDLDTGDVVAHFYRKTYETEPARVTVLDEHGTRLSALTDDSYESTADFALQDDRQTVTELKLTTREPVTSSQIRLGLAKNVALPIRVALTAEDQIVIAQRRLSSTVISFPEVKARQWSLSLTHTQPLRLSELTLVQDDIEETVTQDLRFLAQPGHSYRIYANPDRTVRLTTREGGDLYNDEGVLTLANITPEVNLMYEVADGDEDGVPDTIDNCVSVANADQIDVDDNGRGDACDDFDRDGVINEKDNCINEPNRQQADEDGDGVGDICDGEESRFTEKYTWVPWVGLGTALVVILGMFVVMIRREEVMPVETEPEDQVQ